MLPWLLNFLTRGQVSGGENATPVLKCFVLRNFCNFSISIFFLQPPRNREWNHPEEILPSANILCFVCGLSTTFRFPEEASRSVVQKHPRFFVHGRTRYIPVFPEVLFFPSSPCPPPTLTPASGISHSPSLVYKFISFFCLFVCVFLKYSNAARKRVYKSVKRKRMHGDGGLCRCFFWSGLPVLVGWFVVVVFPLSVCLRRWSSWGRGAEKEASKERGKGCFGFRFFF